MLPPAIGKRLEEPAGDESVWEGRNSPGPGRGTKAECSDPSRFVLGETGVAKPVGNPCQPHKEFNKPLKVPFGSNPIFFLIRKTAPLDSFVLRSLSIAWRVSVSIPDTGTATH